MSQTKPLPDLSPSLEDYLEAIYHLEKEHRIARVRDIARQLEVTMSSVSSALKSLGSKGLIEYAPGRFSTLTQRGLLKAEDVVRRHEILKDFLVSVLHVHDAEAEESACRMEHHLDADVVEKLVRFVEFVKTCPVDQTRWMNSIARDCSDCIFCLDEAEKRAIAREKLREAALAGGLTLAKAETRSYVIIESVTGTDEFRHLMAEAGLESGVMLEVEKSERSSGLIHVSVKGYHLTLSLEDASKIPVKPV
jgi:DtxR family Mn-dependent transcriptional regulator